MRTVLTWLYVPGDRPDRFDKACTSGTDVVVIDWEDAVLGRNKQTARTQTVDWLSTHEHNVAVEIRINAVGSAEYQLDVAALRDCPGVSSVRLPKVESSAQVMTAAADLPESISLVCLLESALGVEEAFSIARSPRAMRIGLGEADLRADLGVRGEGQLEWCRARVVVAARAAGLEPPAMSGSTSSDDLDGLADSCRQGRDAGMLGRAAIHPRQLDVIRRCFRPDADELAAARATLADMSDAVADGSGVFVDRNGRMIDAAVVRSAQRTVGLVDSPTS
jgi:citrate lyase subunit beta/citryl-CoA lyase